MVRQSVHTANKLETTSLFFSSLTRCMHKRLLKLTEQEQKEKRRVKTSMGKGRTWLWMLLYCSTDCCVQLITRKKTKTNNKQKKQASLPSIISLGKLSVEKVIDFTVHQLMCCIFSDNFKFSLWLQKFHKDCKAYTNMRSDLFPSSVQFFSPGKLRKTAQDNELWERITKNIIKCFQVSYWNTSPAFSQWMLAFKKFRFLFYSWTSVLSYFLFSPKHSGQT